MKEFLKKIYTEKFRWYDEILIVSFLSIILVLVGQIVGAILFKAVLARFIDTNNPVIATSMLYLEPIGVWIVGLLWMLVFKHRRPILRALFTEPKGNNLKMLGLGLLIGFGINFGCAVVAVINKDIHISFNSFNPLSFLYLLFCVFIQSSSEEITDRGYLYQSLRRSYRSKWVAIIGNALIFSLLHAMNPGVTMLALLNIFFSGLMFSLFVYYYDSIWCAYGIHTGWNFTQSILLGLPNSGLVVPYSIFTLDTANASNSFAYNVDFGIEGTVLSTVALAVVCFVVWWFGHKRNVEPLDVWADYEIKKTEK